MNYVTSYYYVLIAIVFILYYALPLKIRWLALLAGSLAFYLLLWQKRTVVLLFFLTILISCLCGIVLGRLSDRSRRSLKPDKILRRFALILSLILCSLPFLAAKAAGFACDFHFDFLSSQSLLIPLGCSFYTMQIIAYLVDVSKGSVTPQYNILKYTLFLTFFPQVLQGPIPRYDDLEPQLLQGHRFDHREVFRGMELIVWGWFLKFMIAEKAKLFVNAVFDGTEAAEGFTVLLAGILYSLQLYADFLACTTISQGVAGLFGIHLAGNFDHPYFAASIKDFWRRWHQSLSLWLRDYIYIPLGGNRKGKARKYLNLMITFAVSGIWHGNGVKFLFWGLLHGVYQLVGEWTRPVKTRIYNRLAMPENSRPWKWIRIPCTFFFVMLGWVILRASSLKQGLSMVRSILTAQNARVLTDGSLLTMGLDGKDWNVLIVSLAALFAVSYLQEKRGLIRDLIARQHLLVRWVIYLAAITGIAVFGTYGQGYDAGAFIYEGF